ncbi:hypothetical protein NMG60_11001976 [Bertholletia excelsa]
MLLLNSLVALLVLSLPVTESGKNEAGASDLNCRETSRRDDPSIITKSVLMAVEARHLNLFPSQLIGNREIIGAIEGNRNFCNTAPVGYGLGPLSGTTTDTMLPTMYSSVVTDSIPVKPAMKADSGLTYALPVSRKRSRDSINPSISFSNGQVQNRNSNRWSSLTFLGEDISLQMQQQQLEIDSLIAQHTEKVRLEIEERRKQNSRRIIAAVEEGIMKKLKSKEEEIAKIGQLNWALEERVKSLCVENQIWRDLAQTNEAAANALRSNLEQVLAAQVKDEQHYHRGVALDDEAAALADDAQSCCGSNCDESAAGDRRKMDAGAVESEVMKVKSDEDDSGRRSNGRLCRHCGKHESCVLLLPCRHLCLCTVCGSSVHACPICNTAKKASLHVIISS